MRTLPLGFLTPFALAGAVFLLLPDGQVATAEGCSGASAFPLECWATPAATASWAMTSAGVPTDAPLRFAVEEATARCGSEGPPGGEVANVAIEVLDATNTPVAGTPAAWPIRSKLPGNSASRFEHEWRPAAPLAPSSPHTLRLKGVGAGGAVDLPFTTGPGPHQLPALTAPQAQASTFVQTYSGEYPVVCNELKASPNPCLFSESLPLKESAGVKATVPRASLPALHDSIERHVTVQLEIRLDNGDFFAAHTASLAEPYDLDASFASAQGPYCLRLRYTSDLDGSSVVSEPTCLDTSGLDLSDVIHCTAPAELSARCKVPVTQSEETRQFYDTHCGASGASGSAGASGASGSAGSGGDAAGGGVGVGGTASVAGASGVVAAGSSDSGGCQMQARGGTAGGALGLLALVGLAGARRRRGGRA